MSASQPSCRRSTLFAPLLITLVAIAGCSPSAPSPAPAPSDSRAVPPRILNTEQIESAIIAEYPAELRQEGTGGVCDRRGREAPSYGSSAEIGACVVIGVL